MTAWQKLQEQILEWSDSNYETEEFPEIAEILNFQKNESGQLTYLRGPQFHALETYWYLRLVLNTPKFLELYTSLFSKRSDRFTALGIEFTKELLDYDSDEDYLRVLAQKPENSTLTESINLDYPSYIMALAMGSGKTVLIGTIIATEFALSLEYPEENFMKNALVFAPGTTIIEALKEISDIPYTKLLPPRMYKKFMANLKLIYAQKGDKDIQVQQGGTYNLVVTNTEKIALRKVAHRANQTQLELEEQQKQLELLANQRLNSIASLPNLGIFSDEAHHTYGNKLGEELKRVRETIDHLHNETNLICVVNTTGTPYAGSKTLMDVVYWYGLDQGIKDNILKSLNNGIVAYDFKDKPPAEVFNASIEDFFKKYIDTKLITGQKSKIAYYFKSQEHLEESRALIEAALAKVGQSPSLILMNTQQSSKQEIDEFNRLNDANAAKRIILLVGKGTEGWNCPSLFATALIRELTSSNNFILQASTRCLRQVDGNGLPATIYIESHNQSILNDELKKTFNTSLHELNNTEPELKEINAVFRKTSYPKLEITKVIKRVVASGPQAVREIKLYKPNTATNESLRVRLFSPITESIGIVLSSTGEEREITFTSTALDLFTAAQKISQNYHLKSLNIFDKLSQIYPNGEVPRAHLYELFKQVEAQTTNYEEKVEYVTEALALIKFMDDEGNDVFSKTEDGAYYHTISFNSSKSKLVSYRSEFTQRNKRDLGFHYDPYKFDSEPEQSFLKEILEKLQINYDDVEDIYFTGGLTSTNQTDLHFQYKGVDGKFHNYFPDFVIVKKDGSYLIVEIKAAQEEFLGDKDIASKKKAVERLTDINNNKFKYHIVYSDAPVTNDKIDKVMDMIK